ncbi:MAG: hypothetical protein ACKO96_42780, partial [Flammeovirgaceae bacterium]
MTYAVNPDQLPLLDNLLIENGFDLFESITYLLNRGVKTVLKGKDDISLLSGMVAQMVTVDNSEYRSQKPLWNEIIEKSSGNAIDKL